MRPHGVSLLRPTCRTCGGWSASTVCTRRAALHGAATPAGVSSAGQQGAGAPAPREAGSGRNAVGLSRIAHLPGCYRAPERLQLLLQRHRLPRQARFRTTIWASHRPEVRPASLAE